ncbi:tRNA (adenosine(37)-N6)-threonylcarbamoyltransferase complex ATPase subunit type 1 TsaE [Nocardioides massiliensis]|uniref:tRNA threonylcarbamoyladenosine biosynthesis protein TsaE n=1 Tax=Nocardioides massiliensis TaxID=1325935 RepID=A0ABT9NNR1_9ACTN|nr:tRNA (adenosine(37)-N6)-threonylcarbamoyltransferase complex ATPase subunit type 1 TsaE [Nocardioides massiliensis]MDP9822067.1 tRNA threonylcarbamoyladenosine biosynthesis protein TsaE [Nocardioides massiliensis]
MTGAARVRRAVPADVPAMVEVIHTAFAARPALDPPSTQLEETAASVGRVVDGSGALVALGPDGSVVGTILLADHGERLGLHRVSVLPTHQGEGIAVAMAQAAEDEAHTRGHSGVELGARVELPHNVEFWRNLGYAVIDRAGPHLTMARELPVAIDLATAEDTRAAGARLAGLLRAGDLLILTGDLGAGKTTFTQGLGEGLGVRGQVTSPTFILARTHPSLGDGPGLVHVDAYRLGGIDELDDLDLDTALATSVAVVEWGEQMAEALAEDRLEITLRRRRGSDALVDNDDLDDTDPRELVVTPVGRRWVGAGLRAVLTGARSHPAEEPGR